jgi:hypothetical protein
MRKTLRARISEPGKDARDRFNLSGWVKMIGKWGALPGWEKYGG